MMKQQVNTAGVGWLAGIGGILAAFALACIFALVGCAQPTAKATLSQTVDGDKTTAMVTAVDGNTVTVSVMDGEMPGGEGAPNGEPPAKPGEADAGSTDSTDSTSADDTDSASTDGSSEATDSSDQEKESEGDGSSEPPAKPDGDNGSEPPAKPDGDSNGKPPAKPDSSSDSGNSDSATPPEKPGDGGNAPGDMPTMGGTEMTLTVSDESIIFTSSDGEESQGSIADIEKGKMLQLTVENGTDVTKVVVGDGGMAAPSGTPGGPGQGSGTVNNGTGATTFASNTQTTGDSYTSTEADQNALRVENGVEASITDATITKTGDSSSSEDSDFYGLNAAILAFDGSKLAISGGTVTTDSAGSNGIFSYGEGTEVNVSDTKIRCSQGNSGGIEVAGGATLIATNLDIDTQGESSAAIRSDRGGGTEVVTGGTYSTHGNHSPAVYSTADVTVNGATLSAENTEGVVIEGKNSVKLVDCDVTGNINGNATRTGVVNNVMIYQSMSGDASEGTGSFTMSGGSFDAAHGTLFYVTNTDATIDLEAVDLTVADGQLLVVAGNDGQWGTEGKNGGSVSFTATDQTLEGSIEVDEISSLNLTLADESAYVGAINTEGQAGSVSVTLETGSTWKLDGDSYISELSGDTAGIDLNGHSLFVAGEPWTA